MRPILAVYSIVFAGFAVACSSSSSPSPVDGGKDVATVQDARPDTHDSGKPADAGHDADATSIHDAGVDAPHGLTCFKLVLCDQKCTTSACTDACYSEATGVAQGIFDAYTDCLNVQCPGPDASACDVTATQGACIASFTTCEEDKDVGPADPDGGMVVSAGDAGGEYNCGEYTACVSACPTDAGMSGLVQCTAACSFTATPQAVALAGVLNQCLAVACPAGDAGPCATQGTACAGCKEQAIFAEPNTCAPQFTACEDDTSNTGDAGLTPKALQDGGMLGVTVTGIDQAASNLVVAGGYLYFAQVESDNPVKRLQFDGGAVTTIGPGQQTPAGIAVDANNAYVWSYGTFSGTTSFNNDDGTVVQVPLDGSAAITLRTGMEVLYDAPYLDSVTFDAQSVYWVEGAMGADGAIMKTAIGSTTPQTLFSGREIPEALATDGTNLYWADWGTFDSTGASNNDARVLQGSVNGGTVLTLATNQNAPGSIAVDGTNVYWTNLGRLGADLLPATNSGSVVKVPIGGGTVTTLVSGEAIPVGLAVANGNVYWTEYGLSVPGLVATIPTTGGTVVPLVGGLRNPFSLTLGNGALYWTNTPSSNGQGTILSYTPL